MTIPTVQTREQLHGAVHQFLVDFGMSSPSASVTADGYLDDLECTPSLRMRGLGQVRRVSADEYEVTPEVLDEASVRQQWNGRQVLSPEEEELAFEQATQVFMARGTPEVLARSAANMVVNFRQGKRIRAD